MSPARNPSYQSAERRPPGADMSATSWLDVVNHYDAHFKLNLSDANKDLVEYLKGI
jgi:hypothetical protein